MLDRLVEVLLGVVPESATTNSQFGELALGLHHVGDGVKYLGQVLADPGVSDT